MGLKAKIGLAQLSSYPSYAEFIPTKDFLSGTADFFFNYKKAISILSKSELMQDRGANEDLDIARMGKTFDSKFLKKVRDKKANLIDYTLIFTKWAIGRLFMLVVGRYINMPLIMEKLTKRL